jgi:hypothetical protein
MNRTNIGSDKKNRTNTPRVSLAPEPLGEKSVRTIRIRPREARVRQMLPIVFVSRSFVRCHCGRQGLIVTEITFCCRAGLIRWARPESPVV